MKRFPIVVAMDGSEYSEIVLEHAFDQAARHEATDLHFLTVVERKTKDLEPTRQWLSRAVVDGMDSFNAKPDVHARIHVYAGDPAEEIANLAGELRAQMIVVGNYGTHRHSVAEALLKRAPCSVLAVGLAGEEVASQRQCPDCETVRADSDGRRWFCAVHSAPDRLRLTELVPSTTASRGTVY